MLSHVPSCPKAFSPSCLHTDLSKAELFLGAESVQGFGAKQLQGNQNKVFKQYQGGKEIPSFLF